MLAPVPELPTSRACVGTFIPAVKEHSAWGLCALACLPRAVSCAVSQGSSWEVLLTIGSGIWDPEEKPDLLQLGH